MPSPLCLELSLGASEKKMLRENLVFVKLSESATAPTKGSSGSAGYDLAAAHGAVIEAKCRMLIKTDLAVSVPDGTYGRVAPRSGSALKAGIDVLAGVIDADYRGNIGIVLINLGTSPFTIKSGDFVAQLILERIASNASVEEVQSVSELGRTARGSAGFGSTDKA